MGWVGKGAEAWCGVDGGGEGGCVLVVAGHQGQGVGEAIERADDEGEGEGQIAAEAQAPDFGGGDEGGGAGEDAAAHAAEAFIERDIDAVRQGGDGGEGFVVPGLGFPESGAIEVERGLVVARPGGDGVEIVPARGEEARAAERQFEGDGGEGFGDLIEVGRREMAVIFAGADGGEAGQAFDGVGFIEGEVGFGVERDGAPPGGLGVDEQGGLLGDDAFGEPEGSFFAEQGSDCLFELFDGGAGTVGIESEIERGRASEAAQPIGGAAGFFEGEKAGAVALDGGFFIGGGFGHGARVRGGGWCGKVGVGVSSGVGVGKIGVCGLIFVLLIG